MLDQTEYRISFDAWSVLEKNYVNRQLYDLLNALAANDDIQKSYQTLQLTSTMKEYIYTLFETWGWINDFIQELFLAWTDYISPWWYTHIKRKLENIQKWATLISTGEWVEVLDCRAINRIAFQHARSKEDVQAWIDWIVQHGLESKMTTLYIGNLAQTSWWPFFTELPDDIRQLTCLEKLNINNWYFTKLPTYLPDSLEEIHIGMQFDQDRKRIEETISGPEWIIIR